MILQVDSYRAEGKDQEALKYLDEYIKPDNLLPKHVSSLLLRKAQILATLDESELAIDAYKEVIKYDESIGKSELNLSHLYTELARIQSQIPELKKDGYQIYGTKVTNGNDVKSIAKNSLFAIIMGNEGNGMSDTVSELCDSFVYINMNDKCESLNVGVAASILMYELGSK